MRIRRQVAPLICSISILISFTLGCGIDDAALDNSGSSQVRSLDKEAVANSTVMSYEEYFSKERLLTYTPSTFDDGCIFFVDEVTGFLCKRHRNKRNEKIIVLDEPVGIGKTVNSNFCHAGNNALIAIVDGEKIIEVDYNGEIRKTLYEDDGILPMTYIIASDELVFYLKANTVYRLYRPTGQVDELFTVLKGIYTYTPLSNYVVMYTPIDDDGPYARYHNCKTGEDYMIDESYFDGMELKPYRINDTTTS